MPDQSTAIVRIYDATTNPANWEAALDESIRVIGSQGGSIHLVDFAETSPYVLTHVGGALSQFSEAQFDYYREHLSPLEQEAWAYLLQSPMRTLVEDQEVWPDIEHVRQRADYRYLEEHTGLYRRMIARLNDNRRWFDAVALQFDRSVRDIPALPSGGNTLVAAHGKSH